jgi:hypothetical protein
LYNAKKPFLVATLVRVWNVPVNGRFPVTYDSYMPPRQASKQYYMSWWHRKHWGWNYVFVGMVVHKNL